MAEKIRDDALKLRDCPLIVAELLPLLLHVVSQVLDLTCAVVASQNQQVSVKLLLFTQVLHHLDHIDQSINQSHSMSQMDPRDALCQLLLDVSSQDQQVVMKLLLFAQVLHCPQIKVIGQGQEGQIPLPEKLIFVGGVNMCFQEMRDVVVVLGM